MREYITFDSILNEIRLHANNPINRNVIFLLVEGESDVRLFRKLFSLDFCKVKAIPGGNTELEKAVNLLSIEYNRIIGIRDADFMHLDGKSPTINILFLTDTHDIETMMFASDDTLNAVVKENYSRDNTCTDFRKTFLESVRFLGYIRWYNNLNNLELNFSGIVLNEFIGLDSLTLNERNCIEYVVKRSPNCKCRHIEDIFTGIKSLMDASHDLLQICCGHDVFSIMNIYFNRSDPGKKGISKDTLHSHFRIAYNLEQFKNTSLYAQLEKWMNYSGYKLFD